jgi:hypothetical protein
MMEAESASEMSVGVYETTRCNYLKTSYHDTTHEDEII